MKDIAIYGAGGFGREVASLIKRINRIENQWNFVGFFDDDFKNKPKGSSNEYGSLLGGIDDLNTYPSNLSLILAFGNPKILYRAYSNINNPLIDFPNIVAPEAYVLDWDNFLMGKGNIICSFASMSCNVRLGNFNVFNNRVSLGHDAKVGDFNSFMTAVRISGDSQIGSLNFFGVSSVVLQGVKIGTGTTIGANSVIMRKTKDNSVYVGNPAKKFDFI